MYLIDSCGINIRESGGKEVDVVWACTEKRRGLCKKNSDDFGSIGDEEEGQAKTTMGGKNQGGRERERHTTRADAGPSRAEATR